jgi:hypothetical protein
MFTAIAKKNKERNVFIILMEWYISNNTLGGVSYRVGPDIRNVIKALKYCIEKYHWSMTDEIELITEEDAIYPGAHLLS